MPNKFIPPQTDSVARSAATPLDGEVFYDTDEKKLYYGDGTTVGGLVIGSGGHTIEEEGTPLTQRAKLNFVGDSITVTDDAGNDRTIVTVNVPSGGRELLTANRTYYVRTDGSDSNNGLTNTAGGAFLTIQNAIDVAVSLDISTYNVTIQVSDGTYNQNLILKSFVGSGTIILQGNVTTPANVVLNSPVNRFAIFGDSYTGTYSIRGLRVTSAHVSGGCIYIRGMVALKVGLLDFGATPYHFVLEHGARVDVIDNYTISGGAILHIYAWYNASIDYTSMTAKVVTLTGTPNFSSAFLDASYQGGLYLSASNVSFSGSATGKRYNVTTNGTVLTGGVTLPGSIAGTTATGGQYV